LRNKGWKNINELIDIEPKAMVFKNLIELAPPYLRGLFRKNSQSTYAIYQQISDWRSVRVFKVFTEYLTVFRENKICSLWSLKWQIQLLINLAALLNFNIVNAKAARP